MPSRCIPVALVASTLALAPAAVQAAIIKGSLSQNFSASGSSSSAVFSVKGFNSVDTGLINPVLTGVSLYLNDGAELNGTATLENGVCTTSSCSTGNFTISGDFKYSYPTGPLTVPDSTTASATARQGIGGAGYGGVLSATKSIQVSAASLSLYQPDWKWTASITNITTQQVSGWYLDTGLNQFMPYFDVKYSYTATAPSATVPDPATPALVALGLLGLPLYRRRARKASNSGANA